MAASSRSFAYRPASLIPVAAALGIACGVTVTLVTIFNYLVGPIAAEFGVSKPAVAGALSVHLAMLIFSLPIAGIISDRVGARATIAVSALLFGAALTAAARVDSISGLYATLALAGIVGAGASPISYARAIVHRFTTRRGLALGIALTGTGLGSIVLPMIVQPIVAANGWRAAVTATALITAVVGVAAALLIGDERKLASSQSHGGNTLKEAAASRAFWIMTLAFGLLGVALAGFVAHLTEYWTALGLDPVGVPRFQAAIGMATIAGRIVGGALMDKIPARYVGAGAATAGALGLAGLAGLPVESSGVALVGIAIAVGLCTGTESDVISYLSSRFFGIREFARIYALQGAFFMIGFAIGPVAASLMMGTAGERVTLLVGAIMLVVSALLLLSLRRIPYFNEASL